jgi:dihydroneopterin aldolase
MNPNQADEIQIAELEVQAHVGVPEAERAEAQRLVVSITFTPQNTFRGLGDDLARTVDYAAVCDAVGQFVGAKSFKLIETLAHELAAHLLAGFAIARIRVEVRKFILPDTKHVAVVVVR